LENRAGGKSRRLAVHDWQTANAVKARSRSPSYLLISLLTAISDSCAVSRANALIYGCIAVAGSKCRIVGTGNRGSWLLRGCQLSGRSDEHTRNDALTYLTPLDGQFWLMADGQWLDTHRGRRRVPWRSAVVIASHSAFRRPERTSSRSRMCPGQWSADEAPHLVCAPRTPATTREKFTEMKIPFATPFRREQPLHLYSIRNRIMARTESSFTNDSLEIPFSRRRGSEHRFPSRFSVRPAGDPSKTITTELGKNRYPLLPLSAVASYRRKRVQGTFICGRLSRVDV